MTRVDHRRAAGCIAAMLLMGAAPASTNPWFGVWKLSAKDAGGKPETLIYSDAGNGAMRMVSLEEGSTIVTRFDGRPAEIVAKTGPKRTLAIKRTSPISYSWTFAAAGKPQVLGVNTLSGDGRTFSEVTWLAKTPEKRITLTYERQ